MYRLLLWLGKLGSCGPGLNKHSVHCRGLNGGYWGHFTEHATVSKLCGFIVNGMGSESASNMDVTLGAFTYICQYWWAGGCHTLVEL